MKYYRAFASINDDKPFDFTGPTVTVYTDCLQVIRETPKGVWVADHTGRGERWVSKNPYRKSYAYPTRELAMNSLKIRTGRRISILMTQLAKSQDSMSAIQSGEFESVDLHDGNLQLFKINEVI